MEIDLPPPGKPVAHSTGHVLLVMTTSTFIVMLGMGVIGPILPLYAESFGATTAMVGVLVASFGFARLFMNLPAGQLNERFGRKPILVFAGGIVTFGAFMSGLATTYATLVLWRFVTGLGSAMYTTTSMTVLADISDRSNRGKLMSMYQGGLLLGAGAGPTVGGYLADYFSYQAPFFVYAVMALLGSIWVLLRLPETNMKLSGVRRSRPAEHKTARRGASPDAVRLIALNANFWLISLVSLSIFFTRTGSRTSIVPLLGENIIGLSASQIGLALTLAAGINLVTLYPAGWLLDRFGRKAVIVPSTLITAVGLAAFANCSSWGTFLFSAAVLGLGTGIAGPAPGAYIADIAPEGGAGIAMGMFRTVSDAGFVAGPILLGWLADATGGSYTLSLLANGVLLLFSGVLFGMFARETRTATQPSAPSNMVHSASGR